MTPEVEAIKDAITADVARRQEVEDQAQENLKARRAETATAERELAKFERALASATAEKTENGRLLRSAEPGVILWTIESAASGELDLRQYREQIDPLERRDRHLLRFIDRLVREFIPQAREQRLFALEQEAEAEAALIEAEADIRQRRFELALVPVAELEGEVKVDSSVGLSAELRRKGAEIRTRAASIHQQIIEMQQARKAREIAERKVGL